MKEDCIQEIIPISINDVSDIDEFVIRVSSFVILVRNFIKFPIKEMLQNSWSMLSFPFSNQIAATYNKNKRLFSK
jgi:hypothetical protein